MVNMSVCNVQILEVEIRLRTILENLVQGNSGGGQVDYVTHPNLRNKLDTVQELAGKIEKIMYQKA